MKLNLAFSAKPILLVWVCVVALLGTMNACVAYEKENSQTNSMSLEAQGKRLRADIDKVYQELKSKKQLKDVSLGGNDITDVIQRYLPAGMSFDDAEAILRSAGFTVDHRPRPKHNHPQWYYVTANIKPYDSGFLWSVSVWVALEPPGPNDYTVLRRATGSIHTLRS